MTSRLSTMHRGGTQNIRRTHQLSQQDAFPLLDTKEITICLQSCDFLATEELVAKPTSQFIRSLFEQFLDTFMGLSTETLQKKVRSLNRPDGSRDSNGSDANHDNQNDNNNHIQNNGNTAGNGHNLMNGVDEEEEDDTTQALNIIGLHRAAYKFFQSCGVYDLTIMDIIRPEPSKTKRILSAVVNFARFREEHSAECEQLVIESEASLERIRQVQADNDKVIGQIQGIKRKIEDDDQNSSQKKATLKNINAYNSRIESELKKLKKADEVLSLERKRYKEEKERLSHVLEDFHYLAHNAAIEVDVLKSYSETDLSVLNKIVADLKAQLTEYQNIYDDLNQRDKNMAITIESIQTVENELKNLFRILEELRNEVAKERDELSKLAAMEEILENSQAEIREKERDTEQVERQLNVILEKNEKLRIQADEKAQIQQKELNSIEEKYKKLVEERKKKEKRDSERRDVINEIEGRIDQKLLEHQMEIRNIEIKAARLNSQIRLYLDQVGKKILN
ncbi:myosin-like protein NUF2 [Scheffersomyces xylosifermentans]|uniref:myosin-like protein NUF2 n=1 Tax=Scheffersomyces xylosifermentans TaxID=1304137 RepID=UPI00315CB47E